MKKSLSLLALLPLLLLLNGCGTTARQTATDQPTTSTEAPADSGTIKITGFAFVPPTLTVKKGAVVTWTNEDSVQHSVNSKTFNSELFSQGQSYSFTFNDTGTFDYICDIHPYMTGKIIVK